MATRRMISADIFRDEFFGEQDLFGRLLWIGLITASADDQGRLLNNPRLIGVDVFPLDDSVSNRQITAKIKEFAAAGRILLYEAGGKSLIQVFDWWEQQSPSWAAPSQWPAPEGWVDRVKIHQKGNKVITLNWDQPGGFADPVPAENDLRASVPTDVGTALPTDVGKPVPTCLRRPIVGYASKIEIERECKPRGAEGEKSGAAAQREAAPAAPAAAPAIPGDWCMRVFSKVTDMVSIPGNELDKVLPALDALYAKHNHSEAALVEYLRPFWERWLATRSKSGLAYRKTNCAWLYDWAVAGDGPPAVPASPGGKMGEDVFRQQVLAEAARLAKQQEVGNVNRA